MMDRRKFVTSTVAALAAASVPMTLAPLADAGTRRRLAPWFRERIGQAVELQGENWHLLELADVVENEVSPGLDQFTVVLRGASGDSVSEGIYRVNVTGNSFKLFVQPSGSDDSGATAVVAVSRIVGE